MDYSSDNVARALTNIFEYLGGVDSFIKPGMKIVLKPNLVMKKRPEDAATTHPSLIRELSRIILEKGGKVTVAESPGGMYSEARLREVYRICGIEEVARETGIELNYDLDRVDLSVEDGKYLKKITVVKPLAEADLIINLPKLKTHGQMIYTGAVKNMFGAVPGVLKTDYHFRMPDYDMFANAIIDIHLGIRPQLNIMDGIIGMDGYGPSSGDPKKLGVLLAGTDAFEVDLTALDIINVNPGAVPVIRHAIARGICPAGIEQIELIGGDLDDLRVTDFNLPMLGAMRAIEFYNRGIMKHVVKMLRPRPIFRHDICVGCSDCERNCPAKVIKMNNKKPWVDMSGCIRCFCCQELCPAKAISIRKSLLTRLFS